MKKGVWTRTNFKDKTIETKSEYISYRFGVYDKTLKHTFDFG